MAEEGFPPSDPLGILVAIVRSDPAIRAGAALSRIRAAGVNVTARDLRERLLPAARRQVGAPTPGAGRPPAPNRRRGVRRIVAELSKERLRQDMTLGELAVVSGWGLSTISRMERGLQKSSLAMAEDVAGALGFDLQLVPAKTRASLPRPDARRYAATEMTAAEIRDLTGWSGPVPRVLRVMAGEWRSEDDFVWRFERNA